MLLLVCLTYPSSKKFFAAAYASSRVFLMPYRVYQACGNVDYLWNEVLLATDKGAESGAIHFGLRSVGAAANFVTAMQKSHPDFDIAIDWAFSTSRD